MSDNLTTELKPEVSWDTMRCCGTCFHFGRQIGHGQTIESNAEGACRCNPPTVLPYPDDCSFGTVFPPVNKEDWCGEWKPKADELNAELGSGTCEFMPFADEDWSEPNAVRGVCSECSALMYGKDNYCPNCGARVRKKVDE